MRDIASIIGLKVISSKEGREVGTVSQAIVSLSSGELEGLIVGKGPSEKGIDAVDIEVIGSDAVMVSTHRVAHHLSELPGLMEKRRDPAAGPREVLTASGRRLGVLSTIYLDTSSKRVTRYEVSGGAWRDITEGVLSLSPMEGTVDGRDSIVVPGAAVTAGPADAGGLKQQLAKLSELARTQAQQAAESLTETGDSVKRGLGDMVGAAKKNLSQPVPGTKEATVVAVTVTPPADEAPGEEAAPAPCQCGAAEAPCEPEQPAQQPCQCEAPVEEPCEAPCCQPEPCQEQAPPPEDEQPAFTPQPANEDNGWEASQAGSSDDESACRAEGDDQHNG